MLPRRGLAVVGSMAFLLSGAAGIASASAPDPGVAPVDDRAWQVQVIDDVKISVRVQCSDDDTAAVAVHLVDQVGRGAQYSAVIDPGSFSTTVGPTSSLTESDPIYYFMDSGRTAGPRGTVTIALTRTDDDTSTRTTVPFERPSITCRPAAG